MTDTRPDRSQAMTTKREATLEAALKLARNRLQACAIDYPTGSREMAERSEWADEATAALSTPATEPNGYVDELIEKLRAGVVQCGLHEDNNTELFDIEDANEAMFEAAQALAATPNTDEQDSNDNLIRDANAEQRRSVMSAMKTTGWKRRVHLWFASVFGKISDEMQDIEAQRKRGKDDGYHDEY